MKRHFILTIFICVFQYGWAQSNKTNKFGIHEIDIGWARSNLYNVSDIPYGAEVNLNFYRSHKFRLNTGLVFRYTGTRISSNDGGHFGNPYYVETTERFFEWRVSGVYSFVDADWFRFDAGPMARVGRYYGHLVEAPALGGGGQNFSERNPRVWYRGAGFIFRENIAPWGRFWFYISQSIGQDYFHPYGLFKISDFRFGFKYRFIRPSGETR